MNDLFAKHGHSTEIIKQCGRNRKAAETALTSFTRKMQTNKQTNKSVHKHTKNSSADKIANVNFLRRHRTRIYKIQEKKRKTNSLSSNRPQ